MRRREFIAGLGSVVAWSLAARAQQRGAMRRIGVLMNFGDGPDMRANIAAIEQGLRELNWIVGRNIQIDYRFGAGDPDLLRKYAAELVALAPDVILAQGAVTVQPLLQLTRVVPIVFVGTTDPVGAGFAASLARPGTNATGFSLFEFSVGGKWLDLLKQIAPRVTRVAVVRDPLNPTGTGQFAAIQSAAAASKVELINPDWCAQSRRDPARPHRIRARAEWWPNSDIEHIGNSRSASDHHAGGPPQTARGLPFSLLRH